MQNHPRVALFVLLAFTSLGGCHHAGPHPGLPVDDLGVGDTGVAPDFAVFAGPYADFPSAPIIDSSGPGPGTPTNAPTLFGPAGTGDSGDGGAEEPCLAEPELGALFPMNGLRPRFNVVPNGTQNLFEIRLHAANEAHDLVVYTNNPIWVLPTDVWQGLNEHIVDQPITVSVRAATTNGTTLTTPVSLGPTGDVRIAPAAASGSIVYWTPIGMTTGELNGFSYGQETTNTVLTAAQAGNTCIGCHSSTPDGLYAAFSSRGNGADDTQIAFRSVDGNATPAPYVSSAAATLLARTEQEVPIFSKSHWTTGDRIVLTVSPSLGTNFWDLYWTDVETTSTTQGTGWGLIARTNDPGHVVTASFSHDGNTIAYASDTNVNAGVLAFSADLYTVPYNGRMGGTATPIAGASDPAINEFYPAYSPDDKLVAYTAYPADGSQAYYNPESEVFVIPAAGGTTTRVVANDPPACLHKTSPGIANSWPKWAPAAQVVGSKTYYWMAFSSLRATNNTAQLYVTAVVVENGTIATYPAFYLWNQPADQTNHTPAWDVFDLPIQ